jgi:hypothetical protein
MGAVVVLPLRVSTGVTLRHRRHGRSGGAVDRVPDLPHVAPAELATSLLAREGVETCHSH